MHYRQLATDLLDWYDLNARSMPWRIGPDDAAKEGRPDPYLVWLSEIMLQQTTVATVHGYFLAFARKWPTVADLAAAVDAEVMSAWAGLGYYARARNLLRCARIVAHQFDGRFPDTYDALIDLPGIGPYTAAAIAAIAFDRPETVVDGNVERVMARMFRAETPLPAAKPELARHARALTPDHRPGDYAQAVMDLGATICRPKSPDCQSCPWSGSCRAKRAGVQASLPKKAPKKPKPVRYGIAYLVRRADGAWLLETRPEKGLLGGMPGWPGSDWSDTPAPAPPIAAAWRTHEQEVRHTFTHFHLRLSLCLAKVPVDALPSRGQFVPEPEFHAASLPTLMRKAYDLALPALSDN